MFDFHGPATATMARKPQPLTPSMRIALHDLRLDQDFR